MALAFSHERELVQHKHKHKHKHTHNIIFIMKKTKIYLLQILLFAIGAKANAANNLTTTGGTYELVTEVDDLSVNDIIILASRYYASSDSSTHVTIFKGNMTSTTDVSGKGVNVPDISGDSMPNQLTCSTVNTEDTPHEVVITALSDVASKETSIYNGKRATLKDINNYYLICKSDDFQLNSTNWYCVIAKYIGNATGFENEKDTITAWSTGGTVYRIGCNYTIGTFNKYSTGTSSNQSYVYRKVSIPLTVTDAKYATFCYQNDVQLPANVKAYTYKYDADNDIYVPDVTYDGNNGDTVPSNTGVIVRANAGTYDMRILSSRTGAATSVLRGTTESTTTTGPDSGDYLYYMLYNGDEGIGFYWGGDDGSAFTIDANKAYLAVEYTSTAAKSVRLLLPDEDATAMPNIVSNTTDQPTDDAWYDLTGRRVTPTAAGIYIHNGKKTVKF